MKIMTEKELRAIDPEEFENKDINVKLTSEDEYTGKVIFDYDMGLSILDKENTETCLVGINGPSATNKNLNYENPEQYNDALSIVICVLRSGSWNSKDFYNNLNGAIQPDWADPENPGSVVCSFH